MIIRLNTYFKPWFYDGKTVHWGYPKETYNEALEEAKAMEKQKRR